MMHTRLGTWLQAKRPFQIVAWLGMMLPIVAAVGTELLAPSAREPPFGDWALLEARTLGAMSGEVLTGAYSRYGFRHPGPLTFYVWAPFYSAFGERTIALHVAAGAWNALWLLVAALMVPGRNQAERWLYRAALAVGVAVLATAWLRGNILSEIWNPFTGGVAALALFAAAHRLALGEFRTLPWAFGAHAYAAQSHLQYVLPSTALLIGGLALGLARSRSSDPCNHSRALIVAGGVAVIAWLPVLLDCLTSARPNVMALIAGGAMSHAESRFPWFAVMSFLGQPFSHGLRELGLSSRASAIFGVVFNASALAWVITSRARRRNRADPALALYVLVAMSVWGYAALLPGGRHPSYLFAGIMPLGCMLWVPILNALPIVSEAKQRLVAGLMLTAALALVAAPFWRRMAEPLQMSQDAASLDVIVQAVEACGEQPFTRLALKGPNAWSVGAGVALALVKRKHQVVLAPEEAYRFGVPFEHFLPKDDVQETLVVVREGAGGSISIRGQGISVRCQR